MDPLKAFFSLWKYLYQLTKVARQPWLILGLVLVLGFSYLAGKTEQFYNQSPVQLTYTSSEDYVVNTTVTSPSPFFFAATMLFRVVTYIAFAALVLPFTLFYLIIILVQLFWDDIQTGVNYVVTLFVVLVLVCCAGYSFQDAFSAATRQEKTSDQANAAPQSSALSNEAIPAADVPGSDYYFVSFVIAHPLYILPGQSQQIKLEMVVSDQQKEPSLRLPLLPSSVYTATVEMKSVNFEISSEADASLRQLKLNQETNWIWIVSPKPEARGAQTIAWEVQIDDGRNVSLANVPIISIGTSDVRNWGAFSILLREDFQSVGFLGSWLIVVASFFGRFSAAKAEKVPEIYDKLAGNDPNEILRLDMGCVRKLLDRAYGDEDIDAVCFDSFRPVFNEFSFGMGKSRKIQLLLEHCDRHDEILLLLRFVYRDNPVQFNIYRDHLSKDKSTAETLLRITSETTMD